ncbi:MAG: tetratricopeptide repeat protein [Elusimicrobia bacterium]|nr:tetratricopeptide repeat protein [Elusimicrobiota bacterium]
MKQRSAPPKARSPRRGDLAVAIRIERAQELLEDGQPRQALRLLKGGPAPGLAAERDFLMAEGFRAMGDLGHCRAPYERALRRTDRLSDPTLWLDACAGLVAALRSLGDCRTARKLLAEGRRLARRKDLSSYEEKLSLEDCLLDRAEGRYGKSLGRLRTFLALFLSRSDQAGAGFVLWAMAGARRFSGDLAGSLRDYRRSAAAFARAGDGAGEGYAMLGLGGVERIRGNLAEALRWYGRARAVFAGTQDLFAQAYAECGLGNCLRQLGRPGQARQRYLRSHKMYAMIGDAADLAYVDWGLGKLAMHAGRLAEAEGRLKLALAAFERFRETRGVVLARVALAAVWHARGATPKAESIFDAALRLGRSSGLHAHLEIFT